MAGIIKQIIFFGTVVVLILGCCKDNDIPSTTLYLNSKSVDGVILKKTGHYRELLYYRYSE